MCTLPIHISYNSQREAYQAYHCYPAMFAKEADISVIPHEYFSMNDLIHSLKSFIPRKHLTKLTKKITYAVAESIKNLFNFVGVSNNRTPLRMYTLWAYLARSFLEEWLLERSRILQLAVKMSTRRDFYSQSI